MRVLGHVHTFNDADIIDRTVDSLLNQTRPLSEIVVVDNGSTDGTAERRFPEKVTVLRHRENLGTSGAVITGLRYGLEHGYDWVWIFDADSEVESDALEQLLELYNGFAPARQERICFLACLPLGKPDDTALHGGLFTPKGIAVAAPIPDRTHYSCHVTIWSGCLYRLAAVRKTGLPSPDYVLDWGEFQYGYRIMKAGYEGVIHQKAILHHNIRGQPSLSPSSVSAGPLTFTYYEFPPIRCYYMSRNMIYFCLYEIKEYQFATFRGVLWRVLRLTANFLFRPRNHGPQIKACLLGICHGLTKRIDPRF